MSFATLGLKGSLLRAVEASGYTVPTPIQSQCIPAVLEGGDIMAAAQTGTGKTAGFTLPLLQRLEGGNGLKPRQVRSLIITPTRELAAQIQESVETYGKNEKMRSVVVFGGVNINPQLRALKRGADILVATPGRLLDLYQQGAMYFDDLEILVLDEADRMLDMGFIRDIRKILQLLPTQRQSLLFSATFSDDIRSLARGICHQPTEIDVAPRNTTVESINQSVYQVRKDDKIALLTWLLQESDDQALVFSRTKHGADKLVKKLVRSGVDAAALHGNKSQNQRTRAMNDFRQNKVQVMVATDIAARGIDIDDLALVVNFDLPNVQEDYVHRIGRTGRAGADGRAVSLVGEDERKLLRDIERFIQREIEVKPLPDLPDIAEPVREQRPAQKAANGNGGRRGQRQGGQNSQGSAGRNRGRKRNSGRRSAEAA